MSNNPNPRPEQTLLSNDITVIDLQLTEQSFRAARERCRLACARFNLMPPDPITTEEQRNQACYK